MITQGKFLLMAWCVVLFGCTATAHCAEGEKKTNQTVHLFNGKDFTDWYTFTTETGFDNPGVFQIVDQMIHVPGGKDSVAYYGGLITKQSFENYRLQFEYKWGEATYGARQGKARDSGVMLHCTGPNGPGPWMTSYEFQIIEGGTGDLLLVSADAGSKPAMSALGARGEVENRDKGMYFKPGARSAALKVDDRLNWWGRDPNWKDEVGFRGKTTVESPYGDWTKCEIVARGDTFEYYVNGTLVNRAVNLSVARGKILLQTEGAEVWYRNVELTQLGL